MKLILGALFLFVLPCLATADSNFKIEKKYRHLFKIESDKLPNGTITLSDSTNLKKLSGKARYVEADPSKLGEFCREPIIARSHMPHIRTLIVGPKGRKVGYDPEVGFVNEFDNRGYVNLAHEVHQYAELYFPEKGQYTIQYVKMGDGPYQIEHFIGTDLGFIEAPNKTKKRGHTSQGFQSSYKVTVACK